MHFPVSQRETLEHRQFGCGIAPVWVNPGIRCHCHRDPGRDREISICHHRRIERDFTPARFRKRIGEILLCRALMMKN